MKSTKVRVEYTLHGGLLGWLWMGGKATKNIKLHYVQQEKWERPFVRCFPTLRHALEHVLNDGDFQECELEWFVLEVFVFGPERYIEKTRMYHDHEFPVQDLMVGGENE